LWAGTGWQGLATFKRKLRPRMKLKNCVKETKTKKLRQRKKQIFLKE